MAVDSNTLVQTPKFAYVERVYDSGDFSDLGIDGIQNRGLANPMVIEPAVLDDATHQLLYSVQFSAQGGHGPYTWSVSGSLPSGYSLSSSGLLSGTTTQTGDVTFSVTVTDAEGQSATQTFTLYVA